MPKSWIDRNSDIAEGRDTSAVDGAQYRAPRFTVPQDDEDIFHGAEVRSEAGPQPCTFSRMGAEADAGPMPCTYSRMGAEADAGPMPCTYSRMGAEIAAVEYPRPFCANCRAPEAGLEAFPPCLACRVADDIDLSLLGDSYPLACGSPCRISDDIETGPDVDMTLLGDSYPPPCGFPCRMSDDIETGPDVDMTLLGDSYPPPCGFPCRMSDDIEIGALAENIHPPFCAWCRLSAEGSASALPPCAGACRMSDDVEIGADIEMTAQAEAIPYPCLPPRMPESLQASAAAQLPPPAYYCRQSQ